MIDTPARIELGRLKKIDRKQRRHIINSHVELETERLKTKQPLATQEHLTQQARDKLAARITRERLKEEIKKAKNLALVDNLTNLYNARGFEQRLKEEAIRSKRLGQPFAIVILDANNLGIINNTQGHEAGNAYLQQIAKILEKASRTSDVASREVRLKEDNLQNTARWGGDEFGVLLFDTDLEGVKIWWKRAESLFRENNISIGAGAVMIKSEELKGEDKTLEEIIKSKRHHADLAMYDAKRRSKDMQTRELVIYQ